jgi:spore maturation protein A
MLNYIWAAMIIIGIIVAALTGRMADITQATLTSAEEAVKVCLTMLGIIAMWTGLMKIAERGGLVKSLTALMSPIMRFIFPNVKKGSKAFDYISLNFIANILGLGWAATPAGLMAMKELQAQNPEKSIASREMCAFMIINMSSLQLVTVSIIAHRQAYGSANPSEIIGPGIVATLISSIAAVIFIKVMEVGRAAPGAPNGRR